MVQRLLNEPNRWPVEHDRRSYLRHNESSQIADYESQGVVNSACGASVFVDRWYWYYCTSYIIHHSSYMVRGTYDNTISVSYVNSSVITNYSYILWYFSHIRVLVCTHRRYPPSQTVNKSSNQSKVEEYVRHANVAVTIVFIYEYVRIVEGTSENTRKLSNTICMYVRRLSNDSYVLVVVLHSTYVTYVRMYYVLRTYQ